MSFALALSISKSGVDLAVLAEDLPDEIIPNFIENLADICYNSMLANAPQRTGKLKASIAKTVTDNSFTVGPTADYAPFVSNPTAPHRIVPKTASVLYFQADGGNVFSMYVNHPGTKGNPYILTAAKEILDQAVTVFESVWNDYASE